MRSCTRSAASHRLYVQPVARIMACRAKPASASITPPVHQPADVRLQKLPPTVNWHLEPKCNYTCTFCFASFKDIPELEVVRDLEQLSQVGLLGPVKP